MSLTTNGRGAPFAPTRSGGRETRKVSFGGGRRVTRPTWYFDPWGGGIGIVPRRGLDDVSRAYLSGDQWSGSPFSNPWGRLTEFATTYPLRLLSLLKDVHPLISQGWSNNLALGFAPGDTTIKAVRQADAGEDEVDDGGTAALDSLWEKVGGLPALQGVLADQAMTAGLACLEAVPGARGTGLADVFTFDPLSVRFRQGQPDEPPLVLQQNQWGDWVDLPGETVFWNGLHASRDNPYGRPLFSAALTTGLDDISLQRILRDILHTVAWPRLSVGFPLEELVKFASEHSAELGLLPPGTPPQPEDAPDRRMTASEWAASQFETLRALMETLKPADTFIFAKGGEVETLSGGDLRGTEGTLQMQRHRLVMAVDQPPNLLGITEGGTQAYASVQWKTYAKKLEWFRWFVNSLILKVANLHLRLLGQALTARADVISIRTEDLLMEAQARGLEIDNEGKLIGMGFETAEEASVKLTGSGVVDEEKAGKIGAAPPAPEPPPPPGNPGSDQGQQGENP